jgi:hypothetical protein
MKTEAQRVAIAEACGWTRYDPSPSYWHWKDPKGCWRDENELPDYLNDLNAMHEAEKALEADDFKMRDYEDRLCEILNEANRTKPRWLGPTRFAYARAIAAQRAEAFLRTIGKWSDDK